MDPCISVFLLHFFIDDDETAPEGEGGGYDEEMESYHENEAGHCEDEDFNVSVTEEGNLKHISNYYFVRLNKKFIGGRKSSAPANVFTFITFVRQFMSNSVLRNV